MAKRKYFGEFMANAYCDHMTLTQEHNLDKVESGLRKLFSATELPTYHHYMIGGLPRVTIDPKSFKATESMVEIKFRIQRGSEFEEQVLRFQHYWKTAALTLESPYPHNTIKVFPAGQEKEAFWGPAALVGAKFNSEFADRLKFAVLYVGQAFGDEGSRNAQIRLQNHSTLQSINADMSRAQPDQEVWLLLMDFVPNLMIDMDPRRPTLTTLDEDKAHAMRVMSTEISKGQMVSFVEAALIRYFQPKYNKMFRGKAFPNPVHKTYRECYELDFGSVCAEIAAYDSLIPIQIYSEATPPDWWHFARFPLHSPEERADLWSELLKEGSEVAGEANGS